jgi:hypothetical protein
MPGPDTLQLAGLLACFPAAEHVDVIWQVAVANTADELVSPIKAFTDLSYVRSLGLNVNRPDVVDPEDHVPRELGMIFKHLRLPGVVNLDIRVFDMLGDTRMGKYFDDLSDVLEAMDFPALQEIYLNLEFDVRGLPVEDLWVRLFRVPSSTAGTMSDMTCTVQVRAAR